jgi:extracellular factor (EF) 3-hydroxypalmitic acid methyl ester biosynthesis protein
MIQATCLDEARDRLCSGAGIPAAMKALICDLSELRGRTPHEEWRAFGRESATTHVIGELLRQDPFTRRSFEKPRGYAGDAVMLDYVYGQQGADGATDLGKAILQCLTSSTLAEAVRWRRDVLATSVELLGLKVFRPRVLALACGHLREGHDCDR